MSLIIRGRIPTNAFTLPIAFY